MNQKAAKRVRKYVREAAHYRPDETGKRKNHNRWMKRAYADMTGKEKERFNLGMRRKEE